MFNPFSMMSSLIASYKRYNRTLCELSKLDDRDLADIGLARYEIPYVAWTAWRAYEEILRTVD
jgi:uncharacterized protein YjiS (DUF1127 family)